MRFNDHDCLPLPVCHGRVGRAFRHAFSLIEIMIVVVIIGLMAGVVTLATTGYLERAKKEKARCFQRAELVAGLGFEPREGVNPQWFPAGGTRRGGRACATTRSSSTRPSTAFSGRSSGHANEASR